jgi:NitT/TauT family transport system ATP-binding protein
MHISLEAIFHTFASPGRNVLVVNGVSLSIEPHEFVAVIGPSGCGKSTLLNLVAGVFPPSSGRVVYDDRPLSGLNTDVGYATQRDTLLPWRSVGANVGLPLELRGIGASERERRVQRALDKVGLAGFERAFPHQLSGGMRKRTLIARTLIYEPRTLLLDEPFGSLDAQTRLIMQSELLRLWQEQRPTVVFVTHDLDEAIALADRVVVCTARPTRIKAELSVDIPRPRDVVEIRDTPEYQRVYRTLWRSLQEEVAIAS